MSANAIEATRIPATPPQAPPTYLPPQYQQAQPPFDADDADIILRTSDEVDFHVHKVVLSLASRFFKSMFQLPQQRLSLEAGVIELDVVPTVEESGVLDQLLRFCYPCADPLIATLDELHAVIEAMEKYQMHDVVARAQSQLKAFLESDPVAVFAICCRFGWEDMAKRAARSALAVPLSNFQTGWTVKELRYVTGEQHQALLCYHSQCSAAATAPLFDFRWLNSDSGWVWFTCQSCLPHPSPLVVTTRLGYAREARYVRRWFMDLVERVRAVLNDCPGVRLDPLALLTPVLKQTCGCPNCRESAFEHIFKFLNETLMPRINQELGKVCAIYISSLLILILVLGSPEIAALITTDASA
ncbi:hypothetical protein GGX14DRAFT_343617 [Mycena pura]|uniref:BTB domain-containing protein n=1 Tax=Mycena pura TaxID=153505 RepID=A0AAD6YUD0_9AGAR|nr:hypothetical protein GGX14DRAFT_343617 [Mycena pura]